MSPPRRTQRAAPKKKQPSAARRQMPSALVKRAKEAAEAKVARLRAEASGLVALVKRKKADIADAFYDMGLALARLSAPAMVSALGRKSFADVCTKDCGISRSTATRLIEITKAMTREEVVGLDQQKALALIELAKATPEDDTAGELAHTERLALPGGESLSPRKAGAREIDRAAKTIRHAHQKGSRPRGRTTTPEERATAAHLQARLHELGVRTAKVDARATRPGQEAHLRIEGIPVSAKNKLRAALAG
jgi:hypothetical protein